MLHLYVLAATLLHKSLIVWIEYVDVNMKEREHRPNVIR